MAIKYPENYSLGQSKVTAFPKVQYEKIKEIIDALNDLTDGSITTTDLHLTGDLTVDGTSTLTGLVSSGTGYVLDDGQASAGVYFKSAQETRTGAGAISATTFYTELVTTGANALTLADGLYHGQLKKIKMITDGGDGTLTPTHLQNYTTITFNDVNDTVLLIWDGTAPAWRVMENSGCALA